MKLQINTSEKTLKLEERVNLHELFKLAKQLFPNDEWKEYNLETNTTILNWGNPIVIDRYPVYPSPLTQPYTPFWWQSPTYICGATTAGITAGSTNVTGGDSNAGTYTASNGVYNLEITNSN